MFVWGNHDFDPFAVRCWLSSPTMHTESRRYMNDAFDTNWMSTVGENIDKVEEQIAKELGCGYAVALSSGTASLHMAVKLAGEKLYGKPQTGKGALFGRRVFCSDMTFSATVNPVVYEGGIPVFIGTEYDTWNMDPAALEKAFELYPEVRLIVIAHLYGTPGKIDEIKEIADRHGALIVEDAAESLGARYCGSCTGGSWKETGTFGDYGCISFNGNKIITGSSGGMFLTDSDKDARKVRKLSTQSREDALWYQHEELGYNYRMSNVIAGVVRGQLPYLSEHISQKKNIWERYRDGLKGLPVKMNPIDFEKSQPNYWLSCMIIDRKAMCKTVCGEKKSLYIREHEKSCPAEILEMLFSINAEGRPIWKPMHMQPIYRMNPFVTADDSSDAGEDIFTRGLCLPSDIKMMPGAQERVIEVIRACFE